MTDKKKSRSVPFKQTRAHHANETAEDYVEAVAEIIAETGECRVLDLARHFSVSHVTVSRIVKRLKSEDLLNSEPYRPIKLRRRVPSWPNEFDSDTTLFSIF